MRPVSADWAVTAELDLTCLAAWTAPARVRSHIKFRLTEWGLLSLADDVYLIAGELVANAIEATPDDAIRTRFTREPGAVLLGVWDASNALPISAPVEHLSPADIKPDPHALDPGHDDGTGGWGLPIVKALSSQYGVTPTPPAGKWVWSRIRTR